MDGLTEDVSCDPDSDSKELREANSKKIT
jgi:hypothetical protein